MSTRSRVHLWSLSSFELINSTVFQDATDWRSCNSTCTLNLQRCSMGMRRVLLRANEVLNKLTVLFSHYVFWKAGPLNFIYAPGYLLVTEQPINRREVVPFLLVIYFSDLMHIHFFFLDNNLVLIWKNHFQVRFEMQVTLLLPTTYSRHQMIIMPVKDINWPGIGLSFSLWRQIKMLLGSDTTWKANS